MLLRRRPMRPQDVPESVELIARHPVLGPRYGLAITDLAPAWLSLLGRSATHTTLLEDVENPPGKICFVGFTIFVHDDFIRELKTEPLFWFGPELARRTVRGECPILTDRQLREANSSTGLNLVTWAGCICPEYASCSELYQEIMRAFIESHRGFRWKELIANQMETGERLVWTLSTGGLLWNPREGRYVDLEDQDPEEIVSKPHIVGTTRTAEFQRPASWVGAFFRYHPPRCGFTQREQQLLSEALNGATDEELSEALGVCLATVKKTWLSIYARAVARLPELIEGDPNVQGPDSRRGKEKRRRLLAYIREHPEELRPVSQKLLMKR